MCHRAILRLALTLTLMLTLAFAVLPAAPAEAATTYKVTYSANGGKGAPSAQTKKKGVTLKLSSVKPTRATYTFKGWATSAGAKSATYKPGSSYTGNKALKLYVSPTSGGNPFAKHHLCAKEPWVNDVVNATNSQGRLQYSFHPNHLGQGAYEQILRAYIKDKKWAK